MLDLMLGMGEHSVEISKQLQQNGELLALDISPLMCRRAEKHGFDNQYRVSEADALACPLDDSSVDKRTVQIRNINTQRTTTFRACQQNRADPSPGRRICIS